jgi:hypothetical protein
MLPPEKGAEDYLSEVLSEVKTVFRLVPRPFTAAMIAKAMPAAMRPYSMAVAPESSDRNSTKLCFNSASSAFIGSFPSMGHGLRLREPSQLNLS